MHITFYGAVREVTGSMHLLGTGNDHILLDCGMYQGRRREAAEKNRSLPFDPKMLTNMVLSHAHIDHSGRIPLLVRKGFAGRIFCTRATADACSYLLPDSAHIQEQDAEYLNYKTMRGALTHGHTINGRPVKKRRYEEIRKMLKKKGRNRIDGQVLNSLMDRYHIEGVRPLYTMADADQALTQMDGTPYRHDRGHRKGHDGELLRGRPHPGLLHLYDPAPGQWAPVHRGLHRRHRPVRQTDFKGPGPEFRA